jgi:hypothetical protein
MMFIAFLVELPIAKARMWQKKDPLSGFRQAQFAQIVSDDFLSARAHQKQ